MKNLITNILAVTILVLAALGCSQSETNSANNSNTNNNSNSSLNNSNSENNSNKTDNSNSKKETTKISDNGDVDGEYSITGKNLSKQSYQGDLTIRKQDEVYQFSWNVDGSAYDGVGVREGNLIAVGYGAGENGKGCGAAIYKIGDKTLKGKLGGWGFNSVGTQTAILSKQTKEGGIYSVIGTDTDGTDYSGELYVATSKTDVYHFGFSGGKIKYVGTGIKVGDYFGAGMGVKQCGYVVYEVIGDRLEAAWGVIGNDYLGTEIAKRK